MTDIQVVHGSSLDLDAATFACFDTQISDFPYSPHVHENAASVGVVGGTGPGAHARDLGFAALSEELREQGALAAASVRRWSIVFSDWQGAHKWDAAMLGYGVEPIRWVPWIRWSQPQLSGDRPCTGSEAVLAYHATNAGKPVRKHWNGAGSLTHFAQRCMRGADKHPTEKPLDLILALVSAFSDPGESVIDLTAGSCTTALACRLLGRDCVAVEIDPKWAGHGQQRATLPARGRDLERAREWCIVTHEEASMVAAPKAADGSDVKTWERSQRRLADVARVAAALEAGT